MPCRMALDYHYKLSVALHKHGEYLPGRKP